MKLYRGLCCQRWRMLLPTPLCHQFSLVADSCFKEPLPKGLPYSDLSRSNVVDTRFGDVRCSYKRMGPLG